METKIDLRHMRAFLAIAEERNFTRAALRSHISQSALSKQIRTLEIELGAKVFDRQTRQVVLTKAGRVFKREVIQALEHSHRAASLVRAIVKAEEEPIRIGISMLTDRSRLHYLLEKAEKFVVGEFRYEGQPSNLYEASIQKEESYTLGHFRARSFRYSVSPSRNSKVAGSNPAGAIAKRI